MSDIASLVRMIAQRMEEIARLQTALQALNAKKVEFLQQERLCLEPNLTPSTRHGHHAQTFHHFRLGELKPSYQAIIHDQLTSTITQIENEIERLKRVVESLQIALAAARAKESAKAATK